MFYTRGIFKLVIEINTSDLVYVNINQIEIKVNIFLILFIYKVLLNFS
jgi:hypothetical protein